MPLKLTVLVSPPANQMPDESQSLRQSMVREHFLKPRKRSTPCVGICSTSHGDYVCRGCKRFFNEVRDWQSFEPEQRNLVLDRLAQLKRDSIQAVISVADVQLLYHKTDAFINDDGDDVALRIYEALAHCRGDYAGWGLNEPTSVKDFQDPNNVLKQIEDFYYDASRNTFELTYKIRAS